MTTGKFIGCVMMVVGSAIGAGILAMPMVSAAAGFGWAAVAIVVFWILMTITGLLVAEVSSSLPINACSFNSMAEKTLGGFGRTVTWLSCLLQLYIVLIAYISGEADMISRHVQMPSWISALMFTVIMGSAIFWGTRVVDHFNRGLISIKGVLLIAALVLTLFYVEADRLFIVHNHLLQANHAIIAAPIILSAFNFHFVIPSIRIYVGDETQKLKPIIIVGTTISMVIYMLWLIATLGAVPLVGEDSFASISGQSLGGFIQVLTNIVNNKVVASSINGFANISMTTSFLGVALGLFDFLADGFKRPNTKIGRLQTAGLTFIPPFLVAISYPNVFVAALSYSSIFVAILCVVLPAMMTYRLRATGLRSSCYASCCSKASFVVIILVGLVFAVLPIFTNNGIFG